MNSSIRVDFFINEPSLTERINKSNKYLFNNDCEKYLFSKEESPI